MNITMSSCLSFIVWFYSKFGLSIYGIQCLRHSLNLIHQLSKHRWRTKFHFPSPVGRTKSSKKNASTKPRWSRNTGMVLFARLLMNGTWGCQLNACKIQTDGEILMPPSKPISGTRSQYRGRSFMSAMAIALCAVIQRSCFDTAPTASCIRTANPSASESGAMEPRVSWIWRTKNIFSKDCVFDSKIVRSFHKTNGKFTHKTLWAHSH